jgi:hypothetical protein
MPIMSTQFHDRVFKTSAAGQVEKADAEIWLDALQHYAGETNAPILALIDMREVSFITSAARILFAEATRMWGTQALVFIAAEPTMLQAIRVIELLGERRQVFAFTTLEEAQAFMEAALDPIAA